MISAKLARRSRLTGGSPARVRPKIEYSPVFASPSASDPLAARVPTAMLGRTSRPSRDRLLVAPVRDIELLRVGESARTCVIESRILDQYRDDASRVSLARVSVMPR